MAPSHEIKLEVVICARTPYTLLQHLHCIAAMTDIKKNQERSELHELSDLIRIYKTEHDDKRMFSSALSNNSIRPSP